MDDIYTQAMLEHSKDPKNFIGGKSFDVNGWLVVAGKFPSCAENLLFHLLVQDQIIVDVRWDGLGSAVMKAAASITSEHIKGMNLDDAYEWAEHVFECFSGTRDFSEDLGQIIHLESIRKFPRRVRSAILPAHTLKIAINRTRK